MQHVFYLMLRRLRLPLIVLISVYAISILGLTLIPGQDAHGQPWRMDFFHAIYFVSFLGSTIGLGEVPYAFTDAQRMWTTFIIYAAVVAWLYAIGSILTLIQDIGFRRVLAASLFARRVDRGQEPFYIVCGYGDAGSLLVRELSAHHVHCVVVEKDPDRILSLEVEDFIEDVPGLCQDATRSDTLITAGLKHPLCRGVVALTGSDHANLTIAISCKLLAPDLPVICQSDSKDTAANMDSFGTDHIIDPFEIFASRFAMLFHSPSMYLVYEWMTARMDAPLAEFTRPPVGDWLLCGYGRFGKAVRKHIGAEGVRIRVVEADLANTEAPAGTIEGRGTEADTLIDAGVADMAGIIAGTDNDANNLSIIITARQLNPGLFTVGRQNRRRSEDIFRAANIDMTMKPAEIAARHILGLLLAPLLNDFLSLTHDQDEEWANLLVSRVAGVVEDVTPETWDLTVSPLQAPALFDCLIRGETITLGNLCTHPRNPEEYLPCVPLLIQRDGENRLLPEMDARLQGGDRLLFCGRREAARLIEHLSHDHQTLLYVRTGEDRPGGTLWRWLSRSRGAAPLPPPE